MKLYLRKKMLLIGVIALIVTSLFPILSFSTNARQKVIVINSGHSIGYDPGAVSSQITEAELNELVATYLLQELDQRGYKVYLTHSSNPVLADRTLMSNEEADTLRNVGPTVNAVNPDFVISLHHNFSTVGSTNGYELYWSSYRDFDNEGVYNDPYLWSGQGGYKDTTPCIQAQDSLRFAQILKNHMGNITELSYHGTYERDDYLPAHANAPCILYEGGYLSNLHDINYLTTYDYQTLAANVIANAIDEFFGTEVPPSGIVCNPEELNMQPGYQAQLIAQSLPYNNSDFIWTSSDQNIVTVNNEGIVTAINPGQAIITVSPISNPSISTTSTITVYSGGNYRLEYSTKVEDIGWIGSSNGLPAGTTGQNKKVEAITFTLKDMNGLNVDPEQLSISYRSHVENIGWQDYVGNNEISGSDNESLRVEAIQLSLSGTDSQYYSIYYRAHLENFGWTSFTRDNLPCGSEGFKSKIEAVEAVVLPKDSVILPGGTNPSFYSLYSDAMIRYAVHSNYIGWQEYTGDSLVAGTENRGLAIEALDINLNPSLPNGSIKSTAHISDIGWIDSSNSSTIGTTGQSKNLEAFSLQLTGDIANYYDIYYQAHVSDFGWQEPVSNGEIAGTEGFSKSIEAVKIWLIEK